MSEKYITGALSVTELGLPTTPEMMASIKSLDAINDAEYQRSMPMYSLYEPFVQDYYGGASERVMSESLRVYVTPDGLGVTSVPSKGYVKYFDLYREGFTANDIKFTPDFQKIADENGLKYEDEIAKKTKAFANFYERSYMPLSIRKALISGSSMNDTVPTINTDFYANKGALRGTIVSNVINEAGEVTRTHFIGKASTDVTADDLFTGVTLITEKENYSMMGVLCYCTVKTMATLKNELNWSTSITSVLNQVKFRNETGYSLIEDLQFVLDPMLPEGMVFMCDAGATGEDAFIYRLQSKLAKYRGVAIYQEKGYTAFDNYDVLEGAKYVIQAESWNVLGRGKIVWLDIAHTSSGNTIMHDDGFTVLNNQIALYNKKLTNM